jgi:WD40 repeat protein
LFTGSAHRGGVRSIAFDPDGKTLASVGDDKLGKLWDVAAVTGKSVMEP